MAIVRFSDGSDVYVYYSVHGGIDCGGCRLLHKPVNLPDEAAMIAHLEKHIAAGDHVPDDAFERLRAGDR